MMCAPTHSVFREHAADARDVADHLRGYGGVLQH
jgi:hypothetical protein